MFRKNNKNPHFLQKLANREISGNFIREGKANSQNSSASKLFKTIPSRCVYQLNNVIDLPGNHVFMGTTRCGQFLLTYSFISHMARSSLSQRNKYQLHWWLFRPGQRAAKVAEVQLFADYAVTSILTIGIAQWPTVNQRLVVYGYCNNAEDYLEEDHRRYYLTITTLPSLDCRDCLTVAASFDEEDMAANWDSCVSFSCLAHGLTIHSLFDVTPPYPKFDFDISLKLNNSVVFNTVNFLHVLSFDFENPKPDRPNKSEQNIVSAEINHRVGQIMTTRYPKEYALPYDINEAIKSTNPIAKHVMKPLLLPPTSQPPRASSIFHSREKSPRQWCNRIPNLAMKPVPIRTKVWRRSIIDQAEKVYAFEESEEPKNSEPKFKWYRRKRLADKMYEFCSDEDDEDMENIRPPDKTGLKQLPRYKYLSPTKLTAPKCDNDNSFTKMIRKNVDCCKNDTRYVIPNADCCKRLIRKTDEVIRHENNELNNASDSLKANSCSLDETCCDIRQRDMVPSQNSPKNVAKSSGISDFIKPNPIENSNLVENLSDKRGESNSDETSCDKRLRDMFTAQNSPTNVVKSNDSTFVEPCSDKKQQDTSDNSDKTSCDIQCRDMDQPITVQSSLKNQPESFDTSKLNEISGDNEKQYMDSLKIASSFNSTSCDIQQRNMDKPVTIQIPPIDLPFCVTIDKKEPERLLKQQERLMKEPEPLLKEQEPLLKEPEPFFLSPASVSLKRVKSDINNCDNRNFLSTRDTQSNSSSFDKVTSDLNMIDSVSNSLNLIDSTKNSSSTDSALENIETMEICESNNEKIAGSYVLESSKITDSEDKDCTSSMNIDNNCKSSQVSNTSSTSTEVCISSQDSVSNTSSTNTEVCFSSQDCVSNTSSINTNFCSSSKDCVPNASIDNLSKTMNTVPNSSTRETIFSLNNPSDSVSNLKSTFETKPVSSICNTAGDTVSNLRSMFEAKPRESVSSICNTAGDTVSNLKLTYETSNINHDVRAIIADWEADSISSMSPQSEFSSITTCNSPKVLDYGFGDNCTERHMVIQRFLEIPPRFGCGTTRKHCSQHTNHHRCANITSNLCDLKVFQPNLTKCFRVSSNQYPPIRMRALQPHNRNRRSCFDKSGTLLSPPLCVRYEKEEELKRKKIVGSNKNEGTRFKQDSLLSPPLRFDKEEEIKRKKMLVGGKMEVDSFEAKRRREGKIGYNEIVDNFEVKRKRDMKSGSCSGGEMSDLKRKKIDDTSNSFEDELADILDNIVDRRKISDCSIQLDRRFIEVDEEMISTITDIEDDDQAVGFHCALPLHVHGSAYAQMQMVSNQKVDKLNVPCVLVRQNSLDIEQLCFKAAEVICRCEGFKFWFCDDYDTEIVEVCPLDGSVLIVIFMRLNVEQNEGVKLNAGQTTGLNTVQCSGKVVVDRRHFYQCKCLFVWSPGSQECWLETFTHLRPVLHDRAEADGWSPARREAERMRARAETGFFHLQPAPAIRAFVHRLYDDDDNQTDSALEVQDPTNLMLFRLYPVNSNRRINRNRIVVL